jgi:hypothetical protein
MMLKIREGLILQQSPKHPGLVSRFLLGHQVLNLTEGHHPLDPILWNLHLSLKIENCWEYLKPESGLSVSMRNSKLIHSDLSVSCPSTFSIFFTLVTKGMGGFSLIEGGKTAEDSENLLMVIIEIDLAQQKYDHSSVYWEDNRNLWMSSILDYF